MIHLLLIYSIVFAGIIVLSWQALYMSKALSRAREILGDIYLEVGITMLPTTRVKCLAVLKEKKVEDVEEAISKAHVELVKAGIQRYHSQKRKEVNTF